MLVQKRHGLLKNLKGINETSDQLSMVCVLLSVTIQETDTVRRSDLSSSVLFSVSLPYFGPMNPQLELLQTTLQGNVNNRNTSSQINLEEN